MQPKPKLGQHLGENVLNFYHHKANRGMMCKARVYYRIEIVSL